MIPAPETFDFTANDRDEESKLSRSEKNMASFRVPLLLTVLFI